MALGDGPQYYQANPGYYHYPNYGGGYYWYPSVVQHQPRLGWECPKCGRVYSPDMITCSNCGNDKVTITYDTNESGTTVSP